jgi:serine/threonine-protein kinase
MPATHVQSDQLAAGQLVADKYVVERELGTGGFATVYAARHASVSTLRVAIKVLHAEHLDSELSRKRFRREADTVAALQSRFIVRLLDAGELQDGRPFMAMEFVDGIPLDALLKKCGRLLPAHVARFGVGVLRALEVAHAAGVVHRDLKPANVFAVEEDGEPPYSRVLDFGIAKTMDGSSVPRAGTHTMAGQVVCTPEYAAPELLSGAVTPQVDLYALGHMLAELLDGRAPYDLGTHALLVAAEHLKPEPVPLGPFSANSGLQAVIRRACVKDPAQRYQTARQMLDDLRAALERLPPQPALSLAAPYVLAGSTARPVAATPGQPAITSGVETPTALFTPQHVRQQSSPAAPAPSHAPSQAAAAAPAPSYRGDDTPPTSANPSRMPRLVIGGLAALLVISLVIVAGLLVAGPGEAPPADATTEPTVQPTAAPATEPGQPAAPDPTIEPAIEAVMPATAAEGSVIAPGAPVADAPAHDVQGVRQPDPAAPAADTAPSPAAADPVVADPSGEAEPEPEPVERPRTTRPTATRTSQTRPAATRPARAEPAVEPEPAAPAPAANPFGNIRAIGE